MADNNQFFIPAMIVGLVLSVCVLGHGLYLMFNHVPGWAAELGISYCIGQIVSIRLKLK